MDSCGTIVSYPFHVDRNHVSPICHADPIYRPSQIVRVDRIDRSDRVFRTYPVSGNVHVSPTYRDNCDVNDYAIDSIVRMKTMTNAIDEELTLNSSLCSLPVVWSEISAMCCELSIEQKIRFVCMS